MTASKPNQPRDRQLDLREFLDVLVAAGHITKEQQETVIENRRSETQRANVKRTRGRAQQVCAPAIGPTNPAVQNVPRQPNTQFAPYSWN